MGKFILPLLLLMLLLSGCRSSVLESHPVSPYVNFKFEIQQKAHVKVAVENMYSSIMATPLDTDMPAGNHTITFKISNLTSGVYYFVMEAKGIDNDYYEKTTQKFSAVLP